MSADTPDKSFTHSPAQLVDSLLKDGANFDTVINVLALVCLLSIMNRTSGLSTQNQAITTSSNPLQKILGELSKNEGSGPSPDILMSLLPLLNNPQLKSKINPSNIAGVLSLLNNLGGPNVDKAESAKADKSVKKTDSNVEPPAAAVTSSTTRTSAPPETESAPSETDKASLSRYLNWKTNF